MNYSHGSRNRHTLKDKTKKGTTKDVNEISSKNLMIKDHVEKKSQNIVNKNIKGNLNETIIYNESKDKYIKVDETEKFKLNKNDRQEKSLIKNQTVVTPRPTSCGQIILHIVFYKDSFIIFKLSPSYSS